MARHPGHQAKRLQFDKATEQVRSVVCASQIEFSGQLKRREGLVRRSQPIQNNGERGVQPMCGSAAANEDDHILAPAVVKHRVAAAIRLPRGGSLLQIVSQWAAPARTSRCAQALSGIVDRSQSTICTLLHSTPAVGENLPSRA